MSPRIDLHMHSSVSDGTQRPAELVRAVAEAGLDVFALTDHDQTAGWDEAARAAAENGLVFVPGEEVTATAPGGITVHVLSYLHDPAHEPLCAATRRTREIRDNRARLIVERLAADYPITWADVARRTRPGATVGRPHLADALVDLGAAPDRAAAFAGPLSSHSPYYVPLVSPPAVEAIRMVREAGGVPVLAHPLAAARGRVVSEATVEELAAAGLAGLEVDHRENPAGARGRLRDLARALGLVVTGSSDYHGAGKPNRLGEHLTAPDQLARIEEQASGTPVVRPR